ncbi:hypothetical protein SLS54_000599 [Diplodia seriata]|uniref:Nibrin n=1 Tax=Diplodia seriata TaxID=420778 RepID=A0A1S8BH68_9PEZI|nr:Nibrin [Diplodia seriata]
MWLLTHDGDHTQKKRYWLRPGTSHLLGRTRSDNVDFLFHIDHKSVSRKHLIITIRDVDAASSEALSSSSSPLPRSEVVLTDASKYGTWLDGEKFTGGERVLGGAVVAAAGSSSKRESHEIKLGNWRLAWRLEWQPVVLTASISGGGGGGSSGSGSKKTKKSTSSSATTELSYAELRSRLAPFDVAVVPEYAAGVTTHVVAPKRNNPRVLQALVEGRHVVSEAWVRALEERARKRAPVPDADGGDEVPRAPLEEDFDGSWPRELDFAPPSTNEPVPRPAEMLAPDAERETVFAGYTFVFSDGNQFAQLGPVVEQGTGKALLRELETGSDDTDGFIRYVKNVAGEKGVGEFEDGSEGKGVVVVRLTEPRGKDDAWWRRFYHSVDLGLNQRSINQNEFLDAIITNDASPLRRPLEQESDDEAPPSSIPGPPPSTSVGPSQVSVVPSREGHTQADQSQMDAPPSSEPPVPKTTRKGFRRAVTESRFKGFDEFDPDTVSKTHYISDDDDGMGGVASSHAGPSQSSMAQSQYPGASQARTRATKGKKRQHEPEETVEISDDDDANAIDKLFPATSAMKRRKLEQQLQDAAMESISEEADAAPVKHPKKPSLILPSDLRKSKPETKPVNPKQLAQLARERREKEDEERKKDEEALQEALEGMDIEQMKNLVKVEVMEIRPRKKPVDTEDGNSDDERWKPEWNGRKNFKKFRKRRPGDKDGAGSQAPLRSRRVIVTLQEVEANAAPEDDYLLDNTSTFDSIRTRPRPGKASASDSMRDQAHARKNRSQGTRSMGGTTDADDDDDDDDDNDEEEEASGFFSRSNLRSGLNRSNNSNSGPASAIALGSEDDAEMQDLDREEIAGRPRNENIASALSSVPPHPPPPYSQRAPSSPALSSQTLADSSTQHHHHHHHPNRPNSRASATSASTTNTTTTKRGAMGPPAPSAEQPPPKKQRQTGAAATGRGKAKAKGGGGKRPGRPVAPALLGRGLGAAPRGEEDDDDDDEDEDEDEDDDEDDGDSDGSGGELKFRRRRRW